MLFAAPPFRIRAEMTIALATVMNRGRQSLRFRSGAPATILRLAGRRTLRRRFCLR